MKRLTKEIEDLKKKEEQEHKVWAFTIGAIVDVLNLKMLQSDV